MHSTMKWMFAESELIKKPTDETLEESLNLTRQYLGTVDYKLWSRHSTITMQRLSIFRDAFPLTCSFEIPYIVRAYNYPGGPSLNYINKCLLSTFVQDSLIVYTRKSHDRSRIAWMTSCILSRAGAVNVLFNENAFGWRESGKDRPWEFVLLLSFQNRS